jgi:hypothetical protein
MIKNINSTVLYLCWKIITTNIRQQEKVEAWFHNIMYDIKDKTYNIDDFQEINKTKTELFLFYLTYFIKNGLINDVRVIVVDDNDLYNNDYRKGENNFLNIKLDIIVDKSFIEKHNYIFPLLSPKN